MTKFPGWRTMTGAQRRNAKADAIFEYARAQGHTTFNAAKDQERIEARAKYNALPVTATPEEFKAGHGNWGLTESEYAEAKRLMEIITSDS
jgi:branched-subunit amino acid aminotransferase/4-amino-4-deoxychorismate lyase